MMESASSHVALPLGVSSVVLFVALLVKACASWLLSDGTPLASISVRFRAQLSRMDNFRAAA
eukprot:4563667-Pleurochrysis_carterae.AAC.2